MPTPITPPYVPLPQVSVYRAVLRSPAISALLYGGGGAADVGVLPAIAVLRMVGAGGGMAAYKEESGSGRGKHGLSVAG